MALGMVLTLTTDSLPEVDLTNEHMWMLGEGYITWNNSSLYLHNCLQHYGCFL